MSTNTTYPACPTDPNAWKGQVAGAIGGVLCVAIVCWLIYAVVRFHAEQNRLKTPQGILNEEYRLEQKKREKKTPWWQFWKAKKASNEASPPPETGTPQQTEPAPAVPPSPRPRILYEGTAEASGVDVERPADTGVEFIGPRDLRLPRPGPEYERDVELLDDIMARVRTLLMGKARAP